MIKKHRTAEDNLVLKEPSMGAFKAEYILYLVLPLIFLAPLFRGLFFDREFGVAHMYTAVVAGLYFWFNRDQIRFSRNITDYAGIGLILAYAISFFVAMNSREAIWEVLRVLNYVLVFWLVVKAGNKYQNRRKVMWTLYSSGLIVSFIGIGSAFGTFTYDGAYLEGMISSTLQYHNAGAIYMIASGIIGLYLLITVESPVVKMALAAGNYVIFITSIGAGSRGAMLVTPFALLLQFIGLDKRDKIKYCFASLAVLVPIVATGKKALAFSGQEEVILWAMLLIGMLIAAGTQYLLGKIRLEAIKINKTWLYSAVLVIVVVVGMLFIVKGTTVLPDQVVSRLKSISLKEYSILERTYFYKDAFTMIKEKPVLGYGGGGWNAAYRAYQSYYYNSSEVHSHPLQVWIEAGTLGFLSYAALWLGIILSIVKIMRKRLEQKRSDDLNMAWNAFAAAMALGLHSLIDFSLSLGSVMIFLWVLFGIIRSVDQQYFSVTRDYYFKPGFSYKYRLYLGSLLMVLFFVVAASSWFGSKIADEAFAAFGQGNIEEGTSKIEIATTLDPFNGDLFISKAAINVQLISMDPQNRWQHESNMLKSANISMKRNKNDYKNHMMFARCLVLVNNMDQAIPMAEKAVSFVPLMPSAYEELVGIYSEAAQRYLALNDRVMAEEVVSKAMMIPGRMKSVWNGLSQEEKMMFQGEDLNKISETLQKKLYALNSLVK